MGFEERVELTALEALERLWELSAMLRNGKAMGSERMISRFGF